MGKLEASFPTCLSEQDRLFRDEKAGRHHLLSSILTKKKPCEDLKVIFSRFEDKYLHNFCELENRN